MISEKRLQKKANTYARGVVRALTGFGPRAASWTETMRLVEAAYFNGFQSGVVWQKEQSEKKKLAQKR